MYTAGQNECVADEPDEDLSLTQRLRYQVATSSSPPVKKFPAGHESLVASASQFNLRQSNVLGVVSDEFHDEFDFNHREKRWADSVPFIENAKTNSEDLAKWITAVKKHYRDQPFDTIMEMPPGVPAFDCLMSPWPEETASMFQENGIPPASIDLELKSYARMVCVLLDIPVSASLVESLHLVFSVYKEILDKRKYMGWSSGLYNQNG